MDIHRTDPPANEETFDILVRLPGADDAPRRVAVVALDPAVRRATALYLRLEGGCEVLACTTVQEALARCGEFHPELLLLYLSASDAQAHAKARALCERSGAPLLVLADDEEAASDAALATLGAAEAFVIPVEPQELLASVQRLLAAD